MDKKAVQINPNFFLVHNNYVFINYAYLIFISNFLSWTRIFFPTGTWTELLPKDIINKIGSKYYLV